MDPIRSGNVGTSAKVDTWHDRGRVPMLIGIALTAVAATYVIASFHVNTPLLPAFASILPLAGRTQRATTNLRIGAAIVMFLFAWLGLASVGMLFLPGTVAMAVAMIRT